MKFNELKIGTSSVEYYEGNSPLPYYGDPLGEYSVQQEIVNVTFSQKNITVEQSIKGAIVADGTWEDRFPVAIEYDINIGDKKNHLSYEFRSLNQQEKDKVFLNFGTLLEMDSLEQIIKQDKLSESDSLALAFNLNLRQKMPENLRDFKTFSDLEEKIKQNPEKLHDNLRNLLKIAKRIDNSNEIKTILYNLRNSDNKKFNIEVMNVAEEIIKTCQVRKDNFELNILNPISKRKFLGYNPSATLLNNRER